MHIYGRQFSPAARLLRSETIAHAISGQGKEPFKERHVGNVAVSTESSRDSQHFRETQLNEESNLGSIQRTAKPRYLFSRLPIHVRRHVRDLGRDRSCDDRQRTSPQEKPA